MRARRSFGAVLVLLPLIAAGTARADETLHYRWHLEGFVGAIASIFFPSRGDATLSVCTLGEESLRSELNITSPDSESGEFFRYGAEWEPASGRSLRAWSAYRWRGEAKSKEAEVDAVGVIDIVSAIHTLRLDPPTAQRRLEIWSDGRLYPVVVIPRGDESRRVGGAPVPTHHYSVRALDIPERRRWKGELDLWIASTRHATPVEILVTRRGARLRLEIATLPDPDLPPGAGGNPP